jgi:predicted phosphoadenosine phosphosulfate sulfurtransferase
MQKSSFNNFLSGGNILLSFSGGRTSAFMAKLIFELPKYKNFKKLVVFANTGKEKEETLKFVNEWC